MDNLDRLQERIRVFDTAALAEFLQFYRPQLLSYIERNVGAALRAKIEPNDLLQEVALTAIQSLPKTDLTDRDPFGWLCQLAQQRIIDAGRKHSAQKRSGELEVALNAKAGDSSQDWIGMLAASITSPSLASARNERHAALHGAIGGLASDVQDVLRMRFMENLSTKQIAEKTGKSDVSVRVLLSRTVQKLQQLLSE